MYVACVHVNLHRATYLCVCICIHVFNRLYLSLCPCFTPAASRIHTSYHIFTHHIKPQCVKYRSCNTRIMHVHTRTHKHHLCKHISKHIHVHKLYTRVNMTLSLSEQGADSEGSGLCMPIFATCAALGDIACLPSGVLPVDAMLSTCLGLCLQAVCIQPGAQSGNCSSAQFVAHHRTGRRRGHFPFQGRCVSTTRSPNLICYDPAHDGTRQPMIAQPTVVHDSSTREWMFSHTTLPNTYFLVCDVQSARMMYASICAYLCAFFDAFA